MSAADTIVAAFADFLAANPDAWPVVTVTVTA